MLNNVINIITNSDKEIKYGGPGKVLNNTIKGLNKIGQPYSINEPLKNHRYNWIHNSVKGFVEVVIYKKPSLVGPNLFVFPSEIPLFLPSFSQNIYLLPSSWCIKAWEQLNFNTCRIKSWPVGIDLDEFIPSNSRGKDEVLLYYKKRRSIKVEEVINILEKLNFKINLICYGSYSEDKYLKALNSSSFGVWVGTTESQGIGLQEALATNLPLIVIENSNILDHDTPEINTFPSYSSSFSGTSVPYWDKRCGIIINHLNELEDAVLNMKKSVDTFNPRGFIEETLSLEQCAKNMVQLFEELDFTQYDLAEYKSRLISNFIWFRFILCVQFIRRTLFKIRRTILKYIR